MAENAPEPKPEVAAEPEQKTEEAPKAEAAAEEQKVENAPNLIKDDVTGEMVSKK